MARQNGFEHQTNGLEDRCSILQSYRHKNGAGEGNRTLTASLEGWSSTIELHPHTIALSATYLLYKGLKFLSTRFYCIEPVPSPLNEFKSCSIRYVFHPVRSEGSFQK